jgi:glycerol-3-phosphate dehydrogenase (NAD(P)+)
MRRQPVAVAGAGSFGTALCSLLGGKGLPVALWCRNPHDAEAVNATGRNPRRFSDVELENVRASDDLAACVRGARALVVAVPSFAVAGLARRVAADLAPDVPVLLLSKGLDAGSGRLLPEVVGEILGGPERIALLSGPNHAEELVRGAYAGAVVASADGECASFFQKLVSCAFFRIYTSADVAGVALCGAAKNAIAIAAGVARGLGYGDNTVALLITRGIAEIRRLVLACGGSESTCLGLAGIGDLNVTCCSPHSRNGRFGEALAKGADVAAFEQAESVVVEGAHSAGPLLALAARAGVEMPIISVVRKAIEHEVDAYEAVELLMGRALGAEF